MKPREINSNGIVCKNNLRNLKKFDDSPFVWFFFFSIMKIFYEFIGTTRNAWNQGKFQKYCIGGRVDTCHNSIKLQNFHGSPTLLTDYGAAQK